mmetsp:Transcript_86212/g.180363  ORF Transcript_86212/g.180363 Transcript_86212/m.180363 type:complete len:933 (+) Transcript_86212:85-2883(+)
MQGFLSAMLEAADLLAGDNPEARAAHAPWRPMVSEPIGRMPAARPGIVEVDWISSSGSSAPSLSSSSLSSISSSSVSGSSSWSYVQSSGLTVETDSLSSGELVNWSQQRQRRGSPDARQARLEAAEEAQQEVRPLPALEHVRARTWRTSEAMLSHLKATRGRVQALLAGESVDFAGTPSDADADADTAGEASQPQQAEGRGVHVPVNGWLLSHPILGTAIQDFADSGSLVAASERATSEPAAAADVHGLNDGPQLTPPSVPAPPSPLQSPPPRRRHRLQSFRSRWKRMRAQKRRFRQRLLQHRADKHKREQWKASKLQNLQEKGARAFNLLLDEVKKGQHSQTDLIPTLKKAISDALQEHQQEPSPPLAPPQSPQPTPPRTPTPAPTPAPTPTPVSTPDPNSAPPRRWATQTALGSHHVDPVDPVECVSRSVSPRRSEAAPSPRLDIVPVDPSGDEDIKDVPVDNPTDPDAVTAELVLERISKLMSEMDTMEASLAEMREELDKEEEEEREQQRSRQGQQQALPGNLAVRKAALLSSLESRDGRLPAASPSPLSAGARRNSRGRLPGRLRRRLPAALHLLESLIGASPQGKDRRSMSASVQRMRRKEIKEAADVQAAATAAAAAAAAAAAQEEERGTPITQQHFPRARSALRLGSGSKPQNVQSVTGRCTATTINDEDRQTTGMAAAGTLPPNAGSAAATTPSAVVVPSRTNPTPGQASLSTRAQAPSSVAQNDVTTGVIQFPSTLRAARTIQPPPTENASSLRAMMPPKKVPQKSQRSADVHPQRQPFGVFGAARSQPRRSPTGRASPKAPALAAAPAGLQTVRNRYPFALGATVAGAAAPKDGTRATSPAPAAEVAVGAAAATATVGVRAGVGAEAAPEVEALRGRIVRASGDAIMGVVGSGEGAGSAPTPAYHRMTELAVMTREGADSP